MKESSHMSEKTDKFVRNVLKGKNIKAKEALEETLQEKISKRMMKVLSKEQSKK